MPPLVESLTQLAGPSTNLLLSYEVDFDQFRRGLQTDLWNISGAAEPAKAGHDEAILPFDEQEVQLGQAAIGVPPSWV